MSFTGIFRAKDGLAAVVDSKGSRIENGQLVEDYVRSPKKFFPFNGGVAVTYGANQIKIKNQARLFSNVWNVEDLILNYLQSRNNLDLEFFQSFLMKISSDSDNKSKVGIIVGRKIWDGNYMIESHVFACNYHLKRLAPETACCMTGGDELYTRAFDRDGSLSRISSIDQLQKTAAAKLERLIEFYDEELSYNTVGKPVQSFFVR